MIHAFAYILFILPFTAWLGYELERSYSLAKHWGWLAGAFVTGVIGSQIYVLSPDNFGNFLMHMTGGVASTILFVYTCKTLRLSWNWRLSTLLLLGFVSTLGVLNELAEYLYELLDLGIMSLDRQDTWRDFVANTSGALLAWLVYELTSYLTRKLR
jgi:hypothetical protein